MRKTLLLCILTAFFLVTGRAMCASDETEHQDKAALPILMYHRVSKDSGQQGRFCISPQALERDMLFLKENGYESVFFSDVIAFVDGTGKLPEKPVVLTFDDGNFSDYKYLYPMLKKHEMKAVLSILGKETDKYSGDGRNINYPNLVWPQIAEMVNSGYVEIQSHGYNLHGPNGALKLKGESSEDYEKRLSGDLVKLQNRVMEMTGTTPTIFTYPKGKMSRASGEILKDLGFKGSLGCEEGVNTIEVGEQNKLFKMKRMIRTDRVSAQTALSNYVEVIEKN